MSQRPLFDDVEPKRLPPLQPPEEPTCPMCGARLDGENGVRCRCNR